MQKQQAKKLFLFVLSFAALLALLSVAVAQETPPFDTARVMHDSRSDLYRVPGGAVPAGTSVTLRFTAATGDLDGVSVRMFTVDSGLQALLPMTLANTTPEGLDIWQAVVETGEQPTVWYYGFLLSKGGSTFYYEDDTLEGETGSIEANKGGAGAVFTRSPDRPFQISVYDPAFYTPEWFRNGIIYQIFPDRFRDGDSANNPVNGQELFYGDVPLLAHNVWNEPPVDGRRVRLPGGGGYWNADFFGGDLAGITEKLDYLQALGVTGIYLNPIFLARSNHRYDTVDYLLIDPILGDLEDFRTLVREADARGIVLILDGVFNHMSSDSPLFDRFNRFPDVVGACESVDSPYRDWFVFVPPRGAQPSPCAGSDGNVYYESWFGFDSIPRINNTLIPPRLYFFLDGSSVARTWGGEGVGGWRLDVAGDIDNGRDPANLYWEGFRAVVRDINPEAVIIGEEWGDASQWLLGDEWDTVMNYRFRRGIIGFVRDSEYVDNDGRIPPLTPTSFDNLVRSVEEDYPPMAYQAMMNLVGSHDTSRAFYTVGSDVGALQLTALVQFSLPGAPTIYYGDEIALDAPNLDGQDDPYNRAPYPWGDTAGSYYPAPNENMLAYYQRLGALRQQHPALREGAMITLAADDRSGLYAFLRLDAAAGSAALVVINTSRAERSLELNLDGLVPAGLTLAAGFGSADVTTGGSFSVTVAAKSGEIWAYTAADSAFSAPAAPENLAAAAGDGRVALNWDAVNGAAGYHVYRSPVASGGFERITAAALTSAAFTDETIANGYRYYYTVAAVGADGLIGVQSASVEAVPSLPITRVYYTEAGAAPVSAIAAYGLTAEVSAAVLIDGVTSAEGAVVGVRAEAALLPAGTDLAEADWQPMTYAGEAAGADVYTLVLPVHAPGDYVRVARFSSDAGGTWLVATLEDGSYPMIAVAPSDDTTPPPAPATISVDDIALTGVYLSWAAVADEGLLVYRVYRTAPDGTMTLLAEVPRETTSYVDRAVVDGDRYSYAVTAVDVAANESERVSTAEVTVQPLMIAVTFVVIVPAGTPGPLYIAGDFGAAGLPLWDPAGAGMQLSAAGDDQWALTLELPEGVTIQYKFTRGNWETVEKGPDCEEIANRTLMVSVDELAGLENGEGGYTIAHTVDKWRDLDGCP